MRESFIFKFHCVLVECLTECLIECSVVLGVVTLVLALRVAELSVVVW